MLIDVWRINMLGGLYLRRGQEAVTRFKSRKVASLLAYLAFYPGRPHLRDELLALLWPDDDVDSARNRLRVGLSSLRRQLEPPGVSSGAVLATDRLTVSLRSEAFQSDVARYEDLYARALHAGGTNDLIPLLTAAVESYTGPLLPGYYEDWILTERDRLAQSCLEALRRLSLALAREGDYPRALDYGLRAVQADPYREELHRDVMRLYVAIGQPSAALELYDRLAQQHRSEFSAEPGAAIQRLAAEIAAGNGRVKPVSHGAAVPPASGASANRLASVGAAPAPPSDSSVLTAADPRLEPSGSTPTPLAEWPASGRGDLPVALTRFFGREAEMQALQALIDPIANPGSARLVTLTGIGGTGKTRLALESAVALRTAFSARVWFASLADISSSEQICGTLAEAMRLKRPPQADPLGHVLKALAVGPSLLVLDNFEHLVDEGSALVQELLTHLPDLTCIVTSRRTLGIAGEHEFPVPPLPVPAGSGQRPFAPHFGADLEALASNPTIALFVDRARAVLPDFQITRRNAEDVAALCAELEGIPLAIELAAARSRLLTPAQMRAYLPRRFDLLVNRRAGKDARHRSLHAALEWSYFLLTPDLRRVFALLSVFQGGASMDAIQAVCHPSDALTALEDLRSASLVLSEECSGEMRVRMLETVREYAAEHLSEATAARERHAAWYLALAEAAGPELLGPGQSLWLDCLQCERDNIRLAYETLLSAPRGIEGGLRLVRSLFRFWMLRGGLKEGRRLAEAALARADPSNAGILYADALNAAGVMASAQEDYACARVCYERELAFSRSIDYALGVAWSSANLGTLEIRHGNYSMAWRLLEEALDLHRRAENAKGIALCVSHLGLVADRLGEPNRARSLYQESLALHSALGDETQIASTLGNLGRIAERANDFATAVALQEQSLAIHRKLGNRSGAAMAAGNLGVLWMRQREYGRARVQFADCLACFQELEMPHAEAIALGELGALELLAGNYEEARRLQQEKLAIARRIDSREEILYALHSLAHIMAVERQYDAARRCLTDCLATARESGFRLGIAFALEGWAALALALERREQAAWLYGAVDALRATLDAPLSPVQKELQSPLLDELLGDPASAAAFNAGSSASLDRAIETALSV